MRASLIHGLIAIAAGATPMLSAQTPSVTSQASFEVSSIKRNTGASTMSTMAAPPGRVIIVNTPIAALIRGAYRPDIPELIGAPGWVASERYDIMAKTPTNNPTADERRLMLQTLLSERMMFAAHYETQERPVYALVLGRADGRLGPQIRPSTTDCEALAADKAAGRIADFPTATNGAPLCGGRTSPNGIREYGNHSLTEFADSMTGPAGRKVVNKTGLTGKYDITLKLDPYTPPDRTLDNPISIFTALQEQLGLKLVPDRAPLRTLVIDHIERPTED